MASLNALRREPSKDNRALRLANDLTGAEIAASAVTRNTLILLRRAADSGGLKLTATGNLSRTVVAEMVDLFEWPGFDRAEAFRLHKVVNEPDFLPLFFVRHVAQFAKLVRALSRQSPGDALGKDMLTEDRQRALQAILFHVTFWHADLSYLGRGVHGSWPQRDIGILLWSLSVAAADWQTPEKLTRLCTIPTSEVLRRNLGHRIAHDGGTYPEAADFGSGFSGYQRKVPRRRSPGGILDRKMPWFVASSSTTPSTARRTASSRTRSSRCPRASDPRPNESPTGSRRGMRGEPDVRPPTLHGYATLRLMTDDVAVTAPSPAGRETREQRAWYFYDWANSAYVTTTATVLMAPYLTSIATAAACPNLPDGERCTATLSLLGIPVSPGSLFAYTATVSTIVSVLVLIVVGGIADRSRRPTRMLAGFAWLGAVAAAAMFFVRAPTGSSVSCCSSSPTSPSGRPSSSTTRCWSGSRRRTSGTASRPRAGASATSAAASCSR